LKETTLDDGYSVLRFSGEDRNLDLDFDREDIFPDLPFLKASAERGCGFCGLRRSTLQDVLASQFAKNDDVDGRLGLSMLGYNWDQDDRYNKQIPGDPTAQWRDLSHPSVLASNADLSLKRAFHFDVVAG
jgi:hypothetical protein